MLNIYYIHTYVIGHYRIIDLVSHTTYVVYFNVIHKWRDLQFKVDSEQQFFLETFHGNFFLLSEFLPKSAERNSEEIFFIFYFNVWSGARTLAFTSNKPIHYLQTAYFLLPLILHTEHLNSKVIL